jgi:hypothetical protein
MSGSRAGREWPGQQLNGIGLKVADAGASSTAAGRQTSSPMRMRGMPTRNGPWGNILDVDIEVISPARLPHPGGDDQGAGGTAIRGG